MFASAAHTLVDRPFLVVSLLVRVGHVSVDNRQIGPIFETRYARIGSLALLPLGALWIDILLFRCILPGRSILRSFGSIALGAWALVLRSFHFRCLRKWLPNRGYFQPDGSWGCHPPLSMFFWS